MNRFTRHLNENGVQSFSLYMINTINSEMNKWLESVREWDYPGQREEYIVEMAKELEDYIENMREGAKKELRRTQMRM